MPAVISGSEAATARRKLSSKERSKLRRLLWVRSPGGSAQPQPFGNVHFYRGRYADAQALYERGLAIRERAFGPDHPLVATSLNGLASLYKEQGQDDKARPLYERALAIREHALGPEHELVGASLNNLALIHYNQGRYAEAQALQERALAIRELTLEPDHPDVAASLYNNALVHQARDRYAEAEAFHQKALAIRERALGPSPERSHKPRRSRDGLRRPRQSS